MLFIGFIAIILRIIMLGSERILLKKLTMYDITAVSGLFFFVASILLLPTLLLLPLYDLFIGWQLFLYAIVTSSIYAVGFYFYVRALSAGDTSLVAPLYNSNLLFLLLLGYFFLEENITYYRIMGAAMMFTGMFYLYPGHLKDKLKAIASSKASIFMIIGSLFIAIGRTSDTILIANIPLIFYAFLSNFFIGTILLVIVLLRHGFNRVIIPFKENSRIVFGAGFVNGYSYLFLLVAISILGVTIAEPLSLLSVFITAFLAYKFLKEEIKERMIGTIIMVIGSILLFF